MLTASAVLRGRRPGAGDCASLSIGADVHDSGPFLGLDLKAGVDQSPEDDFSRGLRISDRHRKVVAVENIDEQCCGVSSDVIDDRGRLRHQLFHIAVLARAFRSRRYRSGIVTNLYAADKIKVASSA